MAEIKRKVKARKRPLKVGTGRAENLQTRLTDVKGSDAPKARKGGVVRKPKPKMSYKKSRG